MTLKTITFYVRNSAGKQVQRDAEFEITGYQEKLDPIIDEVRIEPPSGPVGTLFTFTIIAHDPNTPPLALNYTLAIDTGRGDGSKTSIQPTSAPNVFTWQS